MRIRKELIKIKHGLSKTKIYGVHQAMMQRCYKTYDGNYHNYGGRGITVCKEWHNVKRFADWAFANGYQEGLTIDRINVNGNYEPDNCRWVTAKIQANNMRVNRIIEYNGEKHTVPEWADIFGIEANLIHGRLRKGWKIEDLFLPSGATKNIVMATINGETKSLREWARITGINFMTLKDRFENGWGEDELLLPVDRSKNNNGQYLNKYRKSSNEVSIIPKCQECEYHFHIKYSDKHGKHYCSNPKHFTYEYQSKKWLPTTEIRDTSPKWCSLRTKIQKEE